MRFVFGHTPHGVTSLAPCRDTILTSRRTVAWGRCVPLRSGFVNNTLRRLTGDIAVIVIPIIEAPDDPNDIPTGLRPNYDDVADAQADGWDVVGQVMGDDSVVVFLRHRDGVPALGDARALLALTA